MKYTYVVRWEAIVEADSMVEAGHIAATIPREMIDVRLETGSALFHTIEIKENPWHGVKFPVELPISKV